MFFPKFCRLGNIMSLLQTSNVVKMAVQKKRTTLSFLPGDVFTFYVFFSSFWYLSFFKQMSRRTMVATAKSNYKSHIVAKLRLLSKNFSLYPPVTKVKKEEEEGQTSPLDLHSQPELTFCFQEAIFFHLTLICLPERVATADQACYRKHLAT